MRRLTIILFLTLVPFHYQGTLSQATCDATAGTTERSSYYADTIETQMVYSVYLPPCYAESSQDYPVIYLMHGSNEDDNQWQRLGMQQILDDRISDGSYPPVIVVMPFGNWVANENRFGQDSWSWVFLNQVMPQVEEQYRIESSRANRAIGGISRGGFWAFHFALTNPALFSSVGGHSAFFDRYHAAPEVNPLHLAESSPVIDSLRIYLDRGADDYAAPGLDMMAERLNARNIDFTYVIHPEGQHNNTYWGAHLSEYLDFYIEPWKSEPAVTQSHTPSVQDMGILATPASTATPIPSTEATTLLIPAVAFPSLQYEISAERLQSIRLGLLDTNLVLNQATGDALTEYGVILPEGTAVVADETLFNTMWRDRTLFTLLPIDGLSPRYRPLRIDGFTVFDHPEYPLRFEGQTANFDPAKLTRITMSGVTALTRDTRAALDENGIEWAIEAIASELQAPDFTHTSNEVSIYPTCPATSGPLYGGSLSFCSKPEHFDLLTSIGLDIVELSGNHNNDYGYQAYLDTLDWYETHNTYTIGGGRTILDAQKPLMIEHNGNSLVMLACNQAGPYYAQVNEDENATGGVRPGAAPCDLEWLQDVIPTLSAENDLVIVSLQFTEFDQYTPTEPQQYFFRQIADFGADVVVGTQAHFPQTYEFYAAADGTEAFIHYGLGNLFFDQTFFAGRRFFLDQFLIYDGRLVGVDVFPGIIDDMARPRAMTADERENFLFLMFNEYGSQ